MQSILTVQLEKKKKKALRLCTLFLPPAQREVTSISHFSSVTSTYSSKTATIRYAGAELLSEALTCLPASPSLDPELSAVWPAPSSASGILMAGGC